MKRLRLSSNRLFIVISVACVALQTQLILTAPIAITAELFFFPWLVSKGLIPYKDFFDHHGIILYYLLAPISQNHSFTLLNILYISIQTLNLTLVLLLLRKYTSKFLFAVGGIGYVLISFFISDNLLWFEQSITLILLLVVHLILIKKSNYISISMGVLLAIASLIKPTAVIFIFPVLLITKKISPVIPVVVSWLIFLCIYYNVGALHRLIENLFVFNRYISPAYLTHGLAEYKFLVAGFCIGTAAILLYIYTKRTLIKKILILFILASFVFLPPHFPKIHMLPLVTFFWILVCITLKEYAVMKSKMILLALAIIFLLAFAYSEKKALFINRGHQQVLKDKTSNAIIKWIQQHPSDKPFYLFGNKVEVYQQLNQLPPTYYPVKLPFMQSYFSNYEQKTIVDLKKHNVRTVFVSKPIESGFENDQLIIQYIKANYKKSHETDLFTIYKND